MVEILYEFFKVRVSILDMSALSEAMQKFVNTDEYKAMTQSVSDIQAEVKRNKNRNQTDMVKLDELLKKIFAMLEIADLDNLSEVNAELAKALAEIRRINEENERLSARYDGNYAFVKTYTDALELYPEFDKEDVAKVVDIVYGLIRPSKTATFSSCKAGTILLPA